jgi:predicted ATPase
MCPSMLRPGAAPASRTSFVGRRAEIAQLEERIARNRLVTVLGPPGVGKTRLVTRHLERPSAASRELGPGWFCDMREAEDIAGVCSAVARALDVPMTSADGDLSGAIGALLAAQGPGVWVLDNFEQVAGVSKRTIGRWLVDAPELRFVVTSRRRLDLPGEALFDLAPLPLPASPDDIHRSEAVELFIQRVRAVRRDFIVGEADAPIVWEIVRQLDGLPLAIELCAARARVLSMRDLVDALPRRLALLSGDARVAVSAGDHGRSLADSFAASWRLLNAEERTVLSQCSVFRGGFSAEAAEAVVELSTGAASAAPGRWLLDVLHALVDHSMLQVEDRGGRGRFAMLVSLREHAAAHLSPTERAAAERRHAAHYALEAFAWTERAEGPRAREALDWLDAEHHNLTVVHQRALDPTREPAAPANGVDPVSALEVAIALVPRFATRGPYVFALDLLDRALAAATARASPALLARAHVGRAKLQRRAGRNIDAIETAERARALAAQVDDPRLLGHALAELGWNLLQTGRGRQARAEWERALALFERGGDCFGQAYVCGGLAATYAHEDQAEAATPWCERALTLSRASGDLRLLGTALCGAAIADTEQGLRERALERSELALELQEKEGNLSEACTTRLVLGLLEQDRGRLEVARAHYETGLTVMRRMAAGRHGTATLLGYLGTCLEELGRTDAARDALERAVRTLDELGASHRVVPFRACLGALRARAGDLAGAAAAFEAAEVAVSGMAERRYLATAVDVWRGHLDLALARGASAAGQSIAAAEHRRAARGRYQHAAGDTQLRIDVRMALRHLANALRSEADAQLPRPAAADFPRDALVADAGGAWFRPPRGAIVDITGRRPLRRLLVELLLRRRNEPGRPVAADVLARVAWPGEALRHKQAVNRLRVALATLRRLGLGAVLQTRVGGYLLDPGCPVHLVDDARSPEA